MKPTPAEQAPDPRRWWARAFGGMYLAGAVTHLILVTFAPRSYDSFADTSWWPFVTHAWRSVLVPNTGYFVPALIVFEAAVGLLILSRRYRRIGIVAATGFNAALILFGWGFCIWSVPVIALLGWFWHLESGAAEASGPRATGDPVRP